MSSWTAEGATRLLHRAAIAVGALLLLAAATDAQGNPGLLYSGTLDMAQTRVAFLVSGSGGGGTLHFRGKAYPFSVGELGIGGIGVSRVEAVGQVFNLANPDLFPGIYNEIGSGTVPGNALGAAPRDAAGDPGKSTLWLKNADGVVLVLSGKSGADSLSLGADVVNISYK